MGGFLKGLAALCIICFLAWYYATDRSNCLVTGSSESVNGYYVAIGGVFVKLGDAGTRFPDLFELYEKRRKRNHTFIILNSGVWSILDESKGKKILYTSNPPDPADYIYSPPKHYWSSVDKSDESVLTCSCHGSLLNSASPIPSNPTNLERLLIQPMTTVLLVVILLVAYHLWTAKLDVASVAYSYGAVVLEKEYWRMITASFSHFDLMHLGFNTMTLYQFGSLELVYGSLKYAYLSASLVILTMLICNVLYHVLVHRFNRTDMITQQAVGYSCVLFAWMVAVSVRLPKFCPIFLFPSFCFDTWVIPFPSPVGGVAGLPVNLGPLLLLLVTKAILPRSSLTGHLSGILIGYPLAWNLLDGLTPPIFTCLLVVLYLVGKDVDVLRWIRSESFGIRFHELVPGPPLRFHLYLIAWSLELVCTFLLVWFGYGTMWKQIVVRITILALSSVVLIAALKLFWYSESRPQKQLCADVVVIILLLQVFLLFYDAISASSLVANGGLQLVPTGNSLNQLHLFWSSYVVILIVLLASTVAAVVLAYVVLRYLHEMRPQDALLVLLQLDPISLKRDVETFPLSLCRISAEGLSPTEVAAFSGPSHRLHELAPLTEPSCPVTSGAAGGASGKSSQLQCPFSRRSSSREKVTEVPNV